ncbi:MAG: DUF4837 family protein [Flavobacteriales bacterium]|nr:DUF4837 family protein [Flavobacteriales bacterium]
MLRLIISFSFILVLFACNSDEEEKILPATVGDVSEILVVGEKEHWNGMVGDTLRAFFDQPYPKLPQGEGMYDLRFITPLQFVDYEKRQAHIFRLSIGDKEQNRDARITQSEDIYAKGQKIYTFYALDGRSFVPTFNELKHQILYDLEKRTIARGIDRHQTLEDLAINKKVMEKFNVDISIPKGFRVSSESENVTVLKRYRDKALRIRDLGVRSHDISDGIVIYRYNHNSDSTFTLKRQIEIRDSILGLNVVSANEAPMKVEPLRDPMLEEIDLNGVFATKMRGLWRFDSPIMGGPFVNVSFFHEENGYAIGIDGYVFSPKFDKRDFVREVEAILHSAVPVLKPKE